MASDLENSIRDAGQKLADALKNASEIKVETLWVEVSKDGPADFTGARPIAQTIIALDGDSRTTLPMHPADTGVPNLDERLLDIHQRSVSEAIEYRARILNALFSVLQSRIR